MTTVPALLLLADGRFPSGGHAHSAGVEAAVAAGDIDAAGAGLAEFVAGRLQTVGRVEAAFAAALCAACALPGGVDWETADAEMAARVPSPRLRTTSRSLGRQLLRAGERVWPSPRHAECRAALTGGPMQPIAFGVVAHAAGLSPSDAAMATLHHLVSTATTAAVRLLGLDPFAATALAAAVGADMDGLVAEVVAGLGSPGAVGPHTFASLPATTGLLADVMAEHHATWEVRLFAS